MSKIKKFSDFFALFGAFASGMYLIMKFMSLSSSEESSLLRRLGAFFSPELKKDYTVMLILFLLFFVSFLLSRLLPKLPSLHFGFSLLPLAWSFFLFDYIHTILSSQELTDRMKDRPMLLLICAILNTAGAFADCILSDRKNGRNHAVIAAWISSALLAHISLNTFIVTRFLPEDLSEEFRFVHFAAVDAKLSAEDFMPFLWIALIYGILTAISVLLRRVHFLNAILSIAATCYVLDYWLTNDLPLFGAAVAVLAVTCSLCHLFLTFIPRCRTALPAA